MGSEELLYMLNAQCSNHLWYPPGCGMLSLTGRQVETPTSTQLPFREVPRHSNECWNVQFCCFHIEQYLNKTSCTSTWFVKERNISKKTLLATARGASCLAIRILSVRRNIVRNPSNRLHHVP